LIGRYAHLSYSKTFFEWFTWTPDRIWDGPDFWRCAAAPHHEEMAVDQQKGSNALYSATAFEQQFNLRYATAVKHVRDSFEAVWGTPSKAVAAEAEME
jgi:hypothetical protein